MEKRSTLYALLVFGGLIAACFIFAIVLFGSLGNVGEPAHGWTTGTGPKIGVVEVNGVITESKETLGQLLAFRRNPDIKAIVVRVDSPGGAVAPSQEIFHAIQRARQDKKVVVSMGTLAASGGYYIACAADRIFASPGTVTGSIGVISEFPDFSGLLELVHVRATTIKSGPLKDVGSPLRPMTPEEQRYFQSFVDGIYDQFLTDVAQSRKLPKEEVRKIADGRVLSGKQALEAKLVDEIGNFEDALVGAVRLAGLKGDPVAVFPKKRQSFIADLLRDSAEGLAGGAVEGMRGQLGGGSRVELRDARLR